MFSSKDSNTPTDFRFIDAFSSISQKKQPKPWLEPVRFNQPTMSESLYEYRMHQMSKRES
jgi:hypothetical protein